MGAKFKVTDIDTDYVKDVIRKLENRYEAMIDITKFFNKNAAPVMTEVEEYDYKTEEYRTYKFPLAYDVWTMYYYIRSINEDVEIEKSTARFRKLILENPMLSGFNYSIQKNRLIDTKEGFIYHIAILKQKLLAGDDFTAKELAHLMGLTNPAINHRIIRDKTMDKSRIKKVGNRYIIPNNVAKEQIAASQSPVFKDQTLAREARKKKAEMREDSGKVINGQL